MASVLADFRAYLASITAITNLVSTRIVQLPIPETYPVPYIAFTRTGEQPEELCLDDSGSHGINTTYFDVACRAATQEGADAIAVAVKAALIGLRGTMGSRTVKCCDATDCDNDYDIIPPGSDQPEETATVRVEVIHGGL
jgi:hypothetical protein